MSRAVSCVVTDTRRTDRVAIRPFAMLTFLAIAVVGLGIARSARADDAPRGRAVYESVCRVCHGSGVAGSPRFGDRPSWAPRLQKGMPAVYANALGGKGAMPPKGGRLDLPDADVRAAVDFMVRQAVGDSLPGAVPDAKPAAATPGAASSGAAAQRPAATGPAGTKAQPAASVASSAADEAARAAGARVFQSTCSVCHGSGLAGAPRVGDGAAWRARAQAGVDSLYRSALGGKRAMPARGGNAQLADAEVRAAVDYMLQKSGVTGGASAAPAAVAAGAKSSGAATPGTSGASAVAASASAAPTSGAGGPAAAPAPAAASVPTSASASASPSAPSPPSAAVAATADATAGVPAAPRPPFANGVDPNAFNRLLRSASTRHAAPPSDGIHDPENDGTALLQAPEQALAQLPKRNAAGDVDWVKAAMGGSINPRADLADPAAQMFVLDMNIVREVKGSMPDVVYPHAAHTRWLDCSNCHPAIFIPQKGANQISMAAIMLGQKCGVCHGTIAFPVSECRRCHSSPKPVPAGAKP